MHIIKIEIHYFCRYSFKFFKNHFVLLWISSLFPVSTVFYLCCLLLMQSICCNIYTIYVYLTHTVNYFYTYLHFLGYGCWLSGQIKDQKTFKTFTYIICQFVVHIEPISCSTEIERETHRERNLDKVIRRIHTHTMKRQREQWKMD